MALYPAACLEVIELVHFRVEQWVQESNLSRLCMVKLVSNECMPVLVCLWE